MTDNACQYCFSAFKNDYDDGWGSEYKCGTTVTFVDGLGLCWTQSDLCVKVAATDPWELLERAWNEMQEVFAGAMPVDAFKSILEIEDALANYKEIEYNG